MKHILVDLTRAAAVPHVYTGQRYLFAVRGLMQIGSALARAGCRVTVVADQEFIDSAQAHDALERALTIETVFADDETAIPHFLDAYHPDACVLWNGCHLPHLIGACRKRGIDVVLAEAGWFERDNSVFLDEWGVLVGSSLSQLPPDAAPPPTTVRARLDTIARPAERQPPSHPNGGQPIEPGYLLVLLDSGNGWTYFDPRHKDPLTLVDQLRARFPQHRLAVRAHPTERARVASRLPHGAFDASDGSLLDWSAFCTAAIGASSKAAFAPVLFGKPVIMIGGSVASGPRPHPAFPQRNRIAAITPDDLTDESRGEAARAFVYEAVVHRHLYFDATEPETLARNKALAPLLN